MKDTPRAVRMALAVFSPLFWLLPGEFRRQHASEIYVVLHDLLSDALRERGAGGLLNRWFREALDLSTTAVRLHLAGADERARARARKTPHHSTRRVPMNEAAGWKRVPRVAGIACLLGATGLGMLYLALAGAPANYLVVNALALVMGLAAVGLAWTAGQDRQLPGKAVLILGVALLATALFGLSVDGAARWVRVGGLGVQVSLVVLPAMLVSFARLRTPYSTLGMILAALALALQPDRAMAGVLASALAVLAYSTRDPRVVLALVSAGTGFVATMLRPDHLPTAPYVDQILFTSFDVGVLAGLAVTGGAFLLLVPAMLGWRYDPDHRDAYVVFGVVWLATIVAAALGNYPTPVVGFGGSAILGYSLGLSLIPPKLLPSTAGARIENVASATGDTGGDLRLVAVDDLFRLSREERSRDDFVRPATF
jgi:hypothetical protein